MEFERPLPAFYSYAHKRGRDSRYLDELFDALALSRRERLIDDWDDRKIRAGQQWEDILIERARKSRVFLLILTNRFIASDFCITELTIARALYEKRAAAIAPILAEDANWQIRELRDLQVVMPAGKPASRSRAGWTEAAAAVNLMLEALADGTYFADAPSSLPAVPSLLPFAIGRERAMEDFERALRASPRDRPFVCALSGHRQGQNELIEILLTDTGRVREALEVTSANYPVQITDNSWMYSDEAVELALTNCLIAHVEPAPPSTDCAGLASSLAAHPGLAVVRFEFSPSEWRALGNSRFEQFLAYWAKWPELVVGRPLIVFVSIGADLEKLSGSGCAFVPLPSVTRRDMLDWLSMPAVRHGFLVSRLEDHIEDVFGASDSLPMEEFARDLLPFLRKFKI